MSFLLHPQLQKDGIVLGKFELCRVILMNDAQFPWFILVPEIDGISEVFQLDKLQRHLLCDESSYLAEKLFNFYQADKLNIAAIGNLVPQLHLHHVVRYRGDKAWPAPIWGKFQAVPYSEDELARTLPSIKNALEKLKEI